VHRSLQSDFGKFRQQMQEGAMAQSGFRVDLDVLQQKAQYTQNLVPQIQSQLQQLNSEMESLFASWKGQASASFQRLHATWHGDYLQLNQSLDEIGRQLQSNHRTYVSADDSSTVRS
jgi:WXG100 family type VII secretion target